MFKGWRSIYIVSSEEFLSLYTDQIKFIYKPWLHLFKSFCLFSFGNYACWLFPNIWTNMKTWNQIHTLAFLQATSGDELWWPQPSKAFTFSLRICLVCQVLPQVMNSILPDTWHRWADPARGRDRQHEWTCYQTSNQVQVTQLSLLLVNSEHRWSPWTRHGRDATRTTDLMFPVRSGEPAHLCAH